MENTNTNGVEDAKKQYRAEYYQRNRERLLAQMKTYRETNPERIREAQRRWREANEGHTYTDSTGYVKHVGYAHPIANASGVTPQHRIVLWDKLNGQDVPCHWCGKQLFWFTKDYHSRLVTDHVNTVKDDNRPENLVPACNYCNCTREGGQNRKDTTIHRGNCEFDDCEKPAKVFNKARTLALCTGHWQQDDAGKALTPLRRHIRAEITETGRVCTTCDVHKPFDEFYMRSNGTGRQSKCKTCVFKRVQERKAGEAA